LVADHGLIDGPCEVAFLQGAIQLGSGDPVAAREAFDRAATCADPGLRVRSLNARGAASAQRGSMDAADRDHREALALARQAGLRPLALRLLNNLGANAHRRGDTDEALRRFREAVEVSGEVLDATLGRTALANLGTLLQEIGRVGESRSIVGVLLDGARAAGDARGMAIAYRQRARLEQFAGRYDEAMGWSHRSCDLYASAGDAPNVATSRFNTAVLGWQGAPSPLRWVAVEAALAEIRALGRQDLLLDASWEAAHLAPDVGGMARARGDQAFSAVRGVLLDQRAALLTDPLCPALSQLSQALQAPGLTRVYALGLRAMTAGADRQADLQLARREALTAAAGLLGSQLESLEATLEVWATDPVRVPWF
jgi:tetratricopeptide (TPR) repeat protein